MSSTVGAGAGPFGSSATEPATYLPLSSATMQIITAAGSTDLYAGWVAEAKEAAAQLRQRVTEAKHNEEQCCDVLNHALEAVLSLEHAVCAGRLKVQQRQQLPDIVATILSNIQLAQSVVQVSGHVYLQQWQYRSVFECPTLSR